MYFIPRNNKIYNYIAHTSSMRRYTGTFVTVCLFFIIGFYCIYYPLLNLIAMYTHERFMLQKKCEEFMQYDKSNQHLSQYIDTKKNSIQTYVRSSSVVQRHYNQTMFVLQAIAQLGLSLHSYGSSKEKDKKWYIKNSAHFEISGSREKLMMFLQNLNQYQEILTVSNTIFTHKADDLFHMSFNLGLITIQKIV